MKALHFTWPLLAMVIAVSGCATADFEHYQQSITAFKTATDQTSQAVSTQILGIRDWDRERMLEQLRPAADPCELRWVELRKIPDRDYTLNDCAFLAAEIVREGRFSREAIAVRRQVFVVLNDYTSMLSAVATSDAPARWDAAAKGLGGSVASLAKTVGDVQVGDKSRGLSDQLGPLQNLFGEDGPLTQLISFAGQEWINYRRTQALDEIIQKGKPEIDTISQLLREDFKFIRQRDLFLADSELFEPISAYADAVAAAAADPGKVPARNAALESMRRAIETHETATGQIGSIGAAMDGFDDAHAALVAYAASPKEPQDLAELDVVIRRYARAAQAAFDAFQIVAPSGPE
ncbi:MAG: hypothetical protein ACM35H_05780 [Bacteroidota bacterium]|nr:hypothetical protein [Kiloniellaceae bacterium]